MTNQGGSAAGATSSELKPTLGLVGITINAMALIAPGAFLWTTYQLQAPADSAKNMWAAIALATIIALLTASCYATLARAYPEAGAGSSYYYAEAAIIAKEEHKHFRLARLAKFITGWAAHLYYWVYPGIMIGFMGTLVVYIGQLFNPNFASDAISKALICFVFAAIVGTIALFGVTGSTLVNIIINIVQIASLAIFGILAIAYRMGHPAVEYMHNNATSVVLPHDLSGLIFQCTIAILLLVGFESATAMAGEAINPNRDIPRAVILSLLIQSCICYFFEYFAANFFIGNQYQGAVKVMKDAAGKILNGADGKPTFDNATFTPLDPTKTFSDIGQAISQGGLDKAFEGGSILQGFDAAAASGAPIGDMAKIIGDTLFNGGFAFQLILAGTVVMALIGTALSSLSTGVRISYAMGQDRELPAVFGFLHGRYNTPHMGIYFLAVLSAFIGAWGVQNVDNITIITLISNIGTFVLYGITCGVTFVASIDHLLDNAGGVLKTKIIPLLGLVLNVFMVCGIFYYGLFAASASDAAKADSKWALGISAAFFIGGFAYLFISSLATGKSLFVPPDVTHPRREGVGVD